MHHLDPHARFAYPWKGFMKIASKITAILFLVGGIAGVATLYADTSSKPGDVSSRVAAVQTQLTTDYHSVVELQLKARQQKDLIKLNCVNDLLVQAKAEFNIADAAIQELQGGGTAGDQDGLLSKLDAAALAMHNLRQQGGACVGDVELSKVQSDATSTHPIFPDDPTVIPFSLYLEAPVYASPYN
jgi:hypothetical protein